MGVKGGKALGLPGASTNGCSHVAFVETGASESYETAKTTFERLEALIAEPLLEVEWYEAAQGQAREASGSELRSAVPQTPGKMCP